MGDRFILTEKSQGVPVTATYTCGVSAPDHFPMHLNTMCEIYVYVDMEGGADYIVENRCYPLEPYDVILLNPYEPHRVLLHGTGLYERYYFLFPPQCFAFMADDPIALLMHECGLQNNRLSLPPEKKKLLAETLAAFREKRREDASGRLAEYANLLQFLSLLTEHVLTRTQTALPRPAPALSPLLTDTMAYIDNHLSEPITVELIACEMHISNSYLSRMFSEAVGMGMKKYIALRRMGLAKRLLDAGTSVTDTSFACGYADTSHFIHVFKDATGMTPYAYMRR